MSYRLPRQAGVLAIVVAVATIASCDSDRFTSPESRTAAIPRATNLASLNNSPDTIVGSFSFRDAAGELKARDTTTGGTSTDSTFGRKIRYATVYHVKVVDVMAQVAYRQDVGLPQANPVTLSGDLN